MQASGLRRLRLFGTVEPFGPRRLYASPLAPRKTLKKNPTPGVRQVRRDFFSGDRPMNVSSLRGVVKNLILSFALVSGNGPRAEAQSGSHIFVRKAVMNVLL